MVVGVGDPRAAEKMARAIATRGVERAWIVHGHGGLDELSLSGPCSVVEVRNNELREFTINAVDLGLQPADVTSVRGGDPANNAQVVLDTFNGQLGAVRDIVVLNAAAGLTVAGVASSMEEGVSLAQASIDNGSAIRVVEALKVSSNAVAR
jgi:anthranilate phosphoribosyltransferase